MKEIRSLDGLNRLFESLKGSNQSLATNGYQKLHGGLILQWGDGGAIGGNNEKLITFPIAFPNTALSVTSSLEIQTKGNDTFSSFQALSATSFELQNGGVTSSIGSRWFAVGY